MPPPRPRHHPTSRARAPLLLAALAGGSLGAALPVVVARGAQQAPPPGWALRSPPVPVRLAAEAGPPLLPGQGWALAWMDRWEADAGGQERLALDVALPAQGELWLGLADTEGPGARLALDGDGVRLSGGDAQVACALPAPAGGRLRVVLERDAQGRARAEVGPPGQEQRLPCTVGVGPPLRLSVQAGLRRVAITRLAVGDRPAQTSPGAPWGGALLGGVGAGLAGVGLAAAARGRRGAGLVALALSPTLAALPLALTDVEGLLQQLRVLSPRPLLWAVGLPAVASAILGLAIGQGALLSRDRRAPPGWALAILGACAGAPVLVAAGATGGWGPLVGLLFAPLLSAALTRLGPDAAPRLAVAGALAISALVGCGAALLAPRGALAVPMVQLAAVLGALLVWANVRARQVRAFNRVSLACAAGLLVALELALGATATGDRLIGQPARQVSHAPLTEQDLQALDALDSVERVRRFTRYPTGLYPVAPPPRSAPLRIVALGSSSTGGAWQNDDLAAFWPAEVQRLLGPQVQVVNQGVGGWTSLHIRRYVQTRLDLLDPDIVVVYQGNNDSFTRASRPYRALSEGRGGGQEDLAPPRQALAPPRSWLLLRALLRPEGPAGARPPAEAEAVAVPLEDARDNLAAIIDAVRARGGRTLLVAEGVNPRPGAGWGYPAMMAALAQAPDVASLDAGAVLKGPAHFLDACHLTAEGHRVLARAVARELCAEAWIPPGPTCEGPAESW